MSNSQRNIRLANRDDLTAICMIDQVAQGADRKLYLEHSIDSGNCFVATMNESVCGYIIFDQTFFGHSFIHLLVTREDCRRTGVGTSLIRHVEQICPTDKLFTSTNRSNIRMQRFLERLGYCKSGVIENLDDGDPELVYFKLILKK